MFLEGGRFCVELPSRGSDGSGSHAAWNLRPLSGFVALRGLLQCSVSAGSPLVPGSLYLQTSISPTSKITMILEGFMTHYLGKFPGPVRWALSWSLPLLCRYYANDTFYQLQSKRGICMFNSKSTQPKWRWELTVSSHPTWRICLKSKWHFNSK